MDINAGPACMHGHRPVKPGNVLSKRPIWHHVKDNRRYPSIKTHLSAYTKLTRHEEHVVKTHWSDAHTKDNISQGSKGVPTPLYYRLHHSRPDKWTTGALVIWIESQAGERLASQNKLWAVYGKISVCFQNTLTVL